MKQKKISNMNSNKAERSHFFPKIMNHIMGPLHSIVIQIHIVVIALSDFFSRPNKIDEKIYAYPNCVN